ncbi:MAG: hypothetical protein KC468_02380, partial [Myxococcales bacterium]|nr:hypothetical protein [Myxococcales bacterium]
MKRDNTRRSTVLVLGLTMGLTTLPLACGDSEGASTGDSATDTETSDTNPTTEDPTSAGPGTDGATDTQPSGGDSMTGTTMGDGDG